MVINIKTNYVRFVNSHKNIIDIIKLKKLAIGVSVCSSM